MRPSFQARKRAFVHVFTLKAREQNSLAIISSHVIKTVILIIKRFCEAGRQPLLELTFQELL